MENTVDIRINKPALMSAPHVVQYPAKDLLPGHRFKLRKAQRTLHRVMNTLVLQRKDHPDTLKQDSILIVRSDCRQVTLPLDTLVWVEIAH